MRTSNTRLGMSAMASSPAAAFAFVVASSLLFALSRAGSVGLCYGMSGNNLPSPSAVVGLLRSNGVTAVRIYGPDAGALAALSGTGIQVTVGAPNDILWNLASSPANAAGWVRSNIQSHPGVAFRYVVVGNEVDGTNVKNIVPAMENVRNALAAAGLARIRVTTAVSQALLGVTKPASAGAFRNDVTWYMGPVVRFLQRTRAPLLANIYPYFPYASNPGSMDISFALFTAPGTVQQDGLFGYQNMFDVTVDAFYTAVWKMGGPNVPIVVSETGWPSAGGTAASVNNARIYNQNLVNHVRRGTPRRPFLVETYLFSVFNENTKPAGVEQNWGVFFPNMQRVYPLTF